MFKTENRVRKYKERAERLAEELKRAKADLRQAFWENKSSFEAREDYNILDQKYCELTNTLKTDKQAQLILELKEKVEQHNFILANKDREIEAGWAEVAEATAENKHYAELHRVTVKHFNDLVNCAAAVKCKENDEILMETMEEFTDKLLQALKDKKVPDVNICNHASGRKGK